MKSEQHNTTRMLNASQEFTPLVILLEKIAKQILFSSISDEAGETLITYVQWFQVWSLPKSISTEFSIWTCNYYVMDVYANWRARLKKKKDLGKKEPIVLLERKKCFRLSWRSVFINQGELGAILSFCLNAISTCMLPPYPPAWALKIVGALVLATCQRRLPNTGCSSH